MELPKQKDFKSKLTLKIMLTKQTFPKFEQLVRFIEEHSNDFYDIQIHTLMQNNQYSIDSQVDYLDYINEHYPIKRNEKGDYYHDFMGYRIEREDLANLDYDIKQRLYKAHIDGTISHYFEEDHYTIGELNQDDLFVKALRAHRNSEYRKNITKAYNDNLIDYNNLDSYLPAKSMIKTIGTKPSGNK